MTFRVPCTFTLKSLLVLASISAPDIPKLAVWNTTVAPCSAEDTAAASRTSTRKNFKNGCMVVATVAVVVGANGGVAFDAGAAAMAALVLARVVSVAAASVAFVAVQS